MNKKVIYTCLVGNYDDLLQPLVVDDSFDYICFSNDIKEDKVGVWQIRGIPYENKDKARLSRYVKLLPHKSLGDYDWSLWLDANIQIVGKEFYEILNNKISLTGKIFQVPHCVPPRDCIYEEMKFAYVCGKSGLYETFLQNFHLRRDKFPEHFGLFENNIILRKHNDEEVRKVSEMWWMEYCDYTKRDQFSLMYVYWKTNIYPSLLFGESECTRNVPFLKYNFHKVDNGNCSKVKIYRTILRSKISHLFDYLII